MSAAAVVIGALRVNIGGWGLLMWDDAVNGKKKF